MTNYQDTSHESNDELAKEKKDIDNKIADLLERFQQMKDKREKS